MTKCVLCSIRKVKGYYHDVKLTLCCKTCCEKVSDEDGPKLCRPGRATMEFNLRSENLALLYSTYKQNPRCRIGGPVVKFYAIAEVKFLGQKMNEIREAKEALKRERAHEELVRKRQRLETRYRILPNKLPPILKPFVFGDYLKNAKSRTLLRDVRKRYAVRDRAWSLMKDCKAHPQVALDYCMENPDGYVDDYLQVKENMRKVFMMEGDKVLQRLSPIELATLKQTPLKDVVDAFQPTQETHQLIQ
eukprot:g9149.t1